VTVYCFVADASIIGLLYLFIPHSHVFIPHVLLQFT